MNRLAKGRSKTGKPGPADLADREPTLSDVIRLDSLMRQFHSGDTKWSLELSEQLQARTRRAGTYLDELSRSLGMQKPKTGECRLVAWTPKTLAGLEAQLRQQDVELYRNGESVEIESHASDEHPLAWDRSALQDQMACLSLILGVTEQANAADVRQAIRELKVSEGSERVEPAHVASIVVDESFTYVIEHSRRSARQRRLAHRAQQVLNDFWFAPSSDDQPYFASAATKLIETADGLQPKDSLWLAEKSELESNMNARLQAMKTGVTLVASTQSHPFNDTEDSVHVSIQHVAAAGSLPEGIAKLALYASDSEPCLAGQAIRISDSKDSTTEVELSPSNGEESQSASVLFRGHRFTTAITDQSSFANVSTGPILDTARTTVTIQRSIRQRRAICFVFDCSASMHDAVEAELIQNSENSAVTTKFDAARTALLEMMRRLQPDATEVGLVMYGHRMAIGSDDKGLLLQKRYHRQFPFAATIQPFEDVEVALSTGRFGISELALAREHMLAAVPWGQTPLHLAIEAAIDNIHSVGTDAIKDVIVISDGRNYQFNPTVDAVVSVPSLIQKAKDTQTRVHVIGFGVSDEESAVASSEFHELSNGTGGRSVPDVRRASELLRNLEMLSKSERINLIGPQGDRHQIGFGETVSLEDVSAVNSTLQLNVEGVAHRLPVSPGQHLDLQIDPSGRVVTTVPYRKGAPKFESMLLPDGREVPGRIAVHAPKWIDQTCQLELSLQRPDGKVVERPAAIWVEVTAIPRRQERLLPQDPTDVFRSGIFQWLPGKSCPVAKLQCEAGDVHESDFQIQAWCAARLPSEHTIAIDAINKSERSHLPDGTEYELTCSETEIKIQFHHRRQQADSMDPTKYVQLQGGKVVQVDQGYDQESGHSYHKFTMDPTAGHPTSLQVCSVSNLKSIAAKTARPITQSVYPTTATAQATKPTQLR